MQNDYRSADRLSNLCDYALHTNMLSVVTQYIQFDKFNSANGHGRSMSLTAVHNCRAHATLTFWLLVRKCKKKKISQTWKTYGLYIYIQFMHGIETVVTRIRNATDWSEFRFLLSRRLNMIEEIWKQKNNNENRRGCIFNKQPMSCWAPRRAIDVEREISQWKIAKNQSNAPNQ